MNSKNLGVGLIILSITLSLGVTISELLELRNIPEIEVIEENIIASEIDSLTDCEPKDKDLKYQTMPYSYDDSPLFMDHEEEQKLIIIPIPESSEKDGWKKDKTKTDVSEKDEPRDLEKNHTEGVFYLPEKHTAEYRNLLYEEICREK